MGFFSDLSAAWWQFALTFAGLCAWCLQREDKPITARKIKDIVLGSAAVVVIFIFLSAGRGCHSGPADECRPAGPGIYNDC